MAFAFVLLYGQNPIPATLFVIAYSDKGRPLRTIITALLENGFLTKGHDLIIWTIISSSVQSSLSIFAQKYLCKYKDTYFILLNTYFHIYKDSFCAPNKSMNFFLAKLKTSDRSTEPALSLESLKINAFMTC